MGDFRGVGDVMRRVDQISKVIGKTGDHTEPWPKMGSEATS